MRTVSSSLALLVYACASVAAQETRIGDFALVPGTDAMSDRDLTYISTIALDHSQDGADAQLLWRCSGPRIELVLYAPELEDRSGPIPVRWRFDRGPASDRESWRASSLEPLAYAPEETIYPFSEIASESTTVLVRVEDAEGLNRDYRFSLSGLNRALNRLGCVRHLEVLGNRRMTAMYEKAKLPGQAPPGEEGGLSRLIEAFPFVGHRTQRKYAASAEKCWWTLWSVDEVTFFRSEREATAQGYAKSTGCTS